jgi:hypothetical protein
MTPTSPRQFHCAADDNEMLNERNCVLLSSDLGKGGRPLRRVFARRHQAGAVGGPWSGLRPHQLATVASEMETLKALPGSVPDSANPQRLHQFQQVGSVQPERLGRGRAIALRTPERVDDERSSVAIHGFVEWLRCR